MKTLLVAEFREGALRPEYTQLLAFAQATGAETAMFVVGSAAELPRFSGTLYLAEAATCGDGPVLVVAGAGEAAPEADSMEPAETVTEAVVRLNAGGINKKDAIRKVASDRGLSRRDVYQLVIAEEN